MWAWRILGCTAFVIGAIGLVLPVWPTAIFWIVAALAFAKSDPAWAEWIYTRPGIGPPIREFLETGRMTRASRFASLSGMAIAAVFVIIFLHNRPLFAGGGLLLIAIGVGFVITRKRAD